MEELKKHLQSVGKADESWLDLAKRFNILPNGTNKQRSDKVRKIYNRLQITIPKDHPNIKVNTVGIIGYYHTDNVVVPDLTPMYKTTSTTYKDGSVMTTYNEFPNEISKANSLRDNFGNIIKFGSGGTDMEPNYYYDFNYGIPKEQKDKEWEEFRKWKERKTFKSVKQLPKPYLNGNANNVLICGDLHEPFCKEGYLEFCRLQQEVFNCGTVVFIGDVIDQHFSSFHSTDPDGLGGAMELDEAVNRLKKWHSVFPNAIVTTGNHDRIISRKLYSSGVSQRWMKPLHEVLETPTWKYVTEYKHNNILYVHGESGTAFKKSQDELCSVVQGHQHTEGYVQLFNGGKNFSMQVGTGIDFEQYAFAYAQRGKKPILSCGIVMNNIAFLIPFQN